VHKTQNESKLNNNKNTKRKTKKMSNTDPTKKRELIQVSAKNIQFPLSYKTFIVLLIDKKGTSSS